jgi:hypothetical protein
MLSLALLAVSASLGQTAPQDPPIEVKVLVVNYDPLIPAEGNRPLHQVMKWNDPRELAQGYIGDLRTASGGFVQHRIVEWRDVDEFPRKRDGFRYTPETFLSIFRDGAKHHDPDGIDYLHMIESQQIVPMVDAGKIDEVWMFGAPYFGYWESNMAGPGAYFINGTPYPQVKSKKPFAIMGFSYERGVAEMVHNLCHRTENHLKRAFGGWNAWPHQNRWDRFSAYEKTSPGHAGVGNCHFPPNAEKDYDYQNPRTVMSSADDWLRYPNLTGEKRPVNAETWGGPDYHRNYMGWWFGRLPKATGVDEEGRQNNWWKYIYDFAAYDEKGRSVRAAAMVAR